MRKKPQASTRNKNAILRIILASKRPLSVAQIARKAGISRETTYKWLNRLAKEPLPLVENVGSEWATKVQSTQARDIPLTKEEHDELVNTYRPVEWNQPTQPPLYRVEYKVVKGGYRLPVLYRVYHKPMPTYDARATKDFKDGKLKLESLSGEILS